MALALLVLLPVVGLVILSVLSRKAPVLGVSNGRLMPCPAGSHNCVCSQSPEKSVAPFSCSGEQEEALARLDEIISLWPGAKVIERSPTYLRAEFRSQILQFIDDVEFLAAPDETVLHVRSASRVGRSDLGANRRRIEALRDRFEAAQSQ